MVADQLSEILSSKPEIILEPVGRNTAPAIVVSALQANKRADDAVIAVFPADHLIQNEEEFSKCLDIAVEQAAKNKLVTFGVVPTHPETGYGYINAGANEVGNGAPVKRFVEKPNLKTAQEYLEDGGYYWNSGMFVFSASFLIDELRVIDPELVLSCEAAMDKAITDLDFIRLEEASFSACSDISIDYALMEKTKNAWMVPLDASWSDVGSWESLWAASEKDECGNVFDGDVLAVDSADCYVSSENRLVALVGVENTVVVETPDAVLVANKSKTQDVKDIVTQLKQSERSEFNFHREVHRPWGSYDSIDMGERFQVKRITVKPDASLSLQMHHHRAEHWVVVTGTALVQKGDEEILLAENQSIYIPVGEKHRLTNPGKVDLHLIEVQSGSYLGEDDIVRFEDVFGRS